VRDALLALKVEFGGRIDPETVEQLGEERSSLKRPLALRRSRARL
jgi:hypothetical protein